MPLLDQDVLDGGNFPNIQFLDVPANKAQLWFRIRTQRRFYVPAVRRLFNAGIGLTVANIADVAAALAQSAGDSFSRRPVDQLLGGEKVSFEKAVYTCRGVNGVLERSGRPERIDRFSIICGIFKMPSLRSHLEAFGKTVPDKDRIDYAIAELATLSGVEQAVVGAVADGNRVVLRTAQQIVAGLKLDDRFGARDLDQRALITYDATDGESWTQQETNVSDDPVSDTPFPWTEEDLNPPSP